MADVLTKAQRSYNMSRIRSQKTGPELKLRELMLLNGVLNFQTQPKNIFGRPDFYFPTAKLALFVDGCFWHGCTECFRSPKTNKDFWNSKIKKNIARDRTVDKELKKRRIKVIRIREHELKHDSASVLETIQNELC